MSSNNVKFVLLDTSSLDIKAYYANMEVSLEGESNNERVSTAKERSQLPLDWGNRAKINHISSLSRSINEEFKDNIVGLLQSLLDRQLVQLSDLDAVVVVTSPGSYTGLRMGVAAGNGMAMGSYLNTSVRGRRLTKVIGITLFSIFYQVAINLKLLQPIVPTLVLHSTGKGSYYGKMFKGIQGSSAKEIKTENACVIIDEMWKEIPQGNHKNSLVDRDKKLAEGFSVLVEDSSPAQLLIQQLQSAGYNVRCVPLIYEAIAPQDIMKATGCIVCALLDSYKNQLNDGRELKLNSQLCHLGEVVSLQDGNFLSAQYIKPVKITPPKNTR